VRPGSLIALASLAALAIATGLPATSLAASPAPALSIYSEAVPTNFTPGGQGEYLLHVRNVGTLPTDGSPVTVVDRLPPGITATAAGERLLELEGLPPGNSWWSCSGTTVVTCTNNRENLATIAPGPEHHGFEAGPTAPPIAIEVAVSPELSGPVTNGATVTGGGAPEASASQRTTVGSSPAGFGFQHFEQTPRGRDGLPDTTAGSHPFEMTTSFALNNLGRKEPFVVPDSGEVKNLEVSLPQGFVGNPAAIPRCSRHDWDEGRKTFEEPNCPHDTQVGVVWIYLENPIVPFEIPVYNLEPPAGVAAQFGFAFQYRVGIIDFGVATGKGSAVTATLRNATQLGIVRSYLTIWGVPAEHGTGAPLKPLLTNPTSCGTPLANTVRMTSWEEPEHVLTGVYPWTDGLGNQLQTTGCSELHFQPQLQLRPTTSVASAPTGLEVDLKIPQHEKLEELAEAHLKDATVTLPAGVVVSPSAANGLQACSPAQIALGDGSPPTCPDASKIGDVEVKTPLLEEALHGSVYVAQQNENPFHSLLALYLVAEGSGVVIKQPGRVNLDPTTGQVSARFVDNPQLPFSDLKLRFHPGPRAALVTPDACGSYAPSALLSGYNGSVLAPTLEPFTITGGCAHGFTPSFSAGMVSNAAGTFAPFTTTITRQDGDQPLGAVSVSPPPGLLGMLSRVSPCGEPQAAQGTCPQGSLIGHTTATAGPGPFPVTVTGGQVFLTGPYRGAPFGLSIVQPAVAGPFDLGNVVVRASIHVDPHTARVTIVSDPLPTIRQGIPLQIRSITVTVDRDGFMFNPTSCAPMLVDGTIVSTHNVSVPVSSRFQAADCASLPFYPSFNVSTQGNGTFGGGAKGRGASLDVKITQGPGEAAIHKVSTQLPLVLPSRLTTLQQACTDTQFTANPAGCPEGSLVGVARAVTPVLNTPLTGPAYLVSHGGASFPDLDIVLQGEGIRIDLTGSTDIKKGITYSRFETVPDAPISSFELNLPEGPHSVLAAVRNLCALTKTVKVHGRKRTVGDPLLMPTTITGQNGAVSKQNTQIHVTGCVKAKGAKKARKARRAR
jgi:uncharacterized repeat protein (TIGR01451 family)